MLIDQVKKYLCYEGRYLRRKRVKESKMLLVLTKSKAEEELRFLSAAPNA